jgi:nicotinamidase/pyrazinamidase
MSTPDPILAAPASPRAVLLVIDVQNDFMPGGRLPVADGDAVVPLINRLGARFGNVVLTQDWHPADHRSFASQHAGRAPFEQIELPYGAQTLWPDHCVQASDGAALHAGLRLPQAGLIIRKGRARDVDSYSAFVEADRRTPTGLAGYLRERGIDTVYLAGLALDFCVAWSALDARAAGFATAVVVDACRAIDLDDSLVRAWQQMDAAGVQRLAAAALLAG